MKRREEIMADLYAKVVVAALQVGTAYTHGDPDRACDFADLFVERAMAKIYPAPPAKQLAGAGGKKAAAPA